MNHLGLVGVSIVTFVIIGGFSFDSVYGQIDYCLGGSCFCRDTPAGDMCFYDNPFTGGFIIVLVVVGVGAFVLVYYLLRKTKHK